MVNWEVQEDHYESPPNQNESSSWALEHSFRFEHKSVWSTLPKALIGIERFTWVNQNLLENIGADKQEKNVKLKLERMFRRTSVVQEQNLRDVTSIYNFLVIKRIHQDEYHEL